MQTTGPTAYVLQLHTVLQIIAKLMKMKLNGTVEGQRTHMKAARARILHVQGDIIHGACTLQYSAGQ